MQRALFRSFYTENVEAIAKDIVEAMNDLSYQPNIDGLYEEYLNQKTMLKMLLKKDQSGDGTSADASLLDGHKIAACITCSIVKVRLITSSNLEDKEPDRTYSLEKANRANEQLALLSGLSCLVAFMLDDTQNLNIPNSKCGEVSLRFPETYYPKRSDYLSSLTRALYYTNTHSCINPLLMANIYFLLDRYHRQSIELEKLKLSVKP